MRGDNDSECLLRIGWLSGLRRSWSQEEPGKKYSRQKNRMLRHRGEETLVYPKN